MKDQYRVYPPPEVEKCDCEKTDLKKDERNITISFRIFMVYLRFFLFFSEEPSFRFFDYLDEHLV